MKFLRAVNRAIARFNRWIGPTIVADAVVHSGGRGGSQVDPRSLDLLKSALRESAELPED